MADKSIRYTPEFKGQMVALANAGRSRVKQAACDGGRGDGGLTSTEREEPTRLCRD